jgi:predicted nucleic acid-binding protein
MNSLNFPDINLWLAIAAPQHVHAAIAKAWWEKETGSIAFCRLTQLGFLRLLTTAAVMDGKPLSMTEAWRVYDRIYDDDRVMFVAEPPEVDKRFREKGDRKNCITQSVGRCLVARCCPFCGGLFW